MIASNSTSLKISFEFFPPNTPNGLSKLESTAQALASINPAYFSVTHGAGGSTRARTINSVRLLRKLTGIPVAPHIACIASTKDELNKLLNLYKNDDIRHLVVLRGDVPSGCSGAAGDFRHANEFVAFIREQTGNHFHIEVAAYPEFHPQTNHAPKGLQYLKQKIEAGANSAITQYFYNADAYFQLLDDCAKLNLNVPITPGIMPITNYEQFLRFSNQCGAEIPRWMRLRLESYGDDVTSIYQFGEEIVTNLCSRLLTGGAPGLHFYTLNKANPSLAILKNLEVAPAMID